MADVFRLRMESNLYTQRPYRCRLDWGRRGTREAVERGDMLVIVDTLSFSTAVVTAVALGGIIYPCALTDDVQGLAQQVGAEVAVRRRDERMKGRFSLSPVTFLQIENGTRVVLASPNGGACSRYAHAVPYLLVGTLLNAQAVAKVVSDLLDADTSLNVTIIACGERWQTQNEDGELRIAIEDYVGAGAILAYLSQEKSPEARVCEGAFAQVKDEITDILWDCGSGRELREKGFPQDVEHAAQLNKYDVVPVMKDGAFFIGVVHPHGGRDVSKE